MPQCPRCDAPVPETGQTCPDCGGDVSWWTSRGGQVYGPYDWQTLQFCWRDGRVIAEDHVKLGRDEPWLQAGEVLGGAPAAKPATAAPRPRPALATPTTRTSASRKSNRLVIIAVVAVGAFVLLVTMAIMAAIIIPVFGRARQKVQQTTCLSNLKQIGLAFHMYAQANDGLLPPAESWPEALQPYLKREDIYTCPTTGEQYIFDEALGGQTLGAITNPDQVPLAWDAPRGRDPTTGPHAGKFFVVYADGHASGTDQLPQPP